MDERDWLAERFEESRPRLRAVAYRVLGSASEADDAVQEAWLRFSRSGADEVENLDGWLTTIVARVSLNMLHSRKQRREDPVEPPVLDQSDGAAPGGTAPPGGTDPEHEAVLADSVGLALLVVLDTLTPAERLAFVLHDMFAVPFEEIATIVERSPAAARQLASRARRRVQQADAVPEAEATRRQEIVSAFLAASRDGDFEALLAMLDPDIVLRPDEGARQMGGGPGDLRGAAAAAAVFCGRAVALRLALIGGVPGLIWAQGGKIRVVFDFTFSRGKIVAIEMIADPEHLAQFDVVPLSRSGRRLPGSALRAQLFTGAVLNWARPRAAAAGHWPAPRRRRSARWTWGCGAGTRSRRRRSRTAFDNPRPTRSCQAATRRSSRPG
jgi:RNA polymerase sigma factor (sigma-70 family)